MLGQIVDYLHDARVPFHLASYPSEEPEPIAAHRIPSGALLLETQLFLADGRTVLTAFPHGESVTAAAVSAALGTSSVIDGTNDDLPGEFRCAQGSIPPLGQLFGIPLILDEQLAQASVVVFQVFLGSDYIEVPYEDFARLEQPRVARLASAGVLDAPSGAV
jgi:Ala-tRNA(Pro) deacylase